MPQLRPPSLTPVPLTGSVLCLRPFDCTPGLHTAVSSRPSLRLAGGSSPSSHHSSVARCTLQSSSRSTPSTPPSTPSFPIDAAPSKRASRTVFLLVPCGGFPRRVRLLCLRQWRRRCVALVPADNNKRSCHCVFLLLLFLYPCP